jgi:hypothetical protein
MDFMRGVTAGSVTGMVSGWRKKMLRCPDMWARAVSKEERKARYRFRISRGGPWAVCPAGLDWFPGALFVFSFLFLFPFSIVLISFIDFA